MGRDWFTPRVSRMFAAVFGPLADKPVQYLEIGVCMGVSLAWVAQNILRHPESRAVGIDFWDLDPAPARSGHAIHWERIARERLAPYSSKVEIIKGDSRAVLAEMAEPHRERFDIVYIDGDHHYAGVMADSVLTWPLAKPGAIVVWDDAKMGAGRAHDRKPGVKEALDDFLREYAGRYEFIVPPRLRQVWVTKKG